jgi:hypothetical protein
VDDRTPISKPSRKTQNEIVELMFDLRRRLKDLNRQEWQKCSDQERAYAALAEVLRTLYLVDDLLEDRFVADPLLKLLSALRDLDRGVIVPMLQAKQRTNSDSSERKRLKDVAAATMSLLMETGVPRIEAAKQVATQLRRGGVTFGDPQRSSEPWRTVAAWRDQAVKSLKEFKASKDNSVALYGWWIRAQIPVNEQQIERWRGGLLEWLLTVARQDDTRKIRTTPTS